MAVAEPQSEVRRQHVADGGGTCFYKGTPGRDVSCSLDSPIAAHRARQHREWKAGAELLSRAWTGFSQAQSVLPGHRVGRTER